LVIFPNDRIIVAVVGLGIWRTRIPALVLIGFWFVTQLISGVGSITSVAQAQSGVAYFAHIGGFVAGLLLVKPFAMGRPAGPEWA
jgi:membrane associated rhomboid family serine protease